MFAALIPLVLAMALPHEDVRQRIARVDARLAEEGPSAALFVERAELLRRHRDFAEALEDLARATALAPGSIDADLSRAHVFADLGRPEEARAPLERVLRARPNEPDGLLLAGEIYAASGDLEIALVRYEAALAKLDAPRPAHFLARAQVIRRLDARADLGPERALAALDAGIARLGQVPALVLAAIEYDVERDAIDSAIGRLDKLAAHATRKEHWLVQRAAILQQGGRLEEALASYRAADSALRSLPARHRNNADTRALAETIRKNIETLARTPQ